MQEGYDADVIATGNEIVYGRLVDTNSCWIAKKLTEYGVKVRRITCVGDDVEDIAKAVTGGLTDGRSIIVLTGGLGSSADDLTVEAVAKAVEGKVTCSRKAFKMLQARCEAFSIELTPRRRRMARLVVGAEPIENPVGLAPAMKLRSGKTLILSLPGIPKEMKSIFKRYVLPLIDGNTGRRVVGKDLRLYMDRDLFLIIQLVQRQFPNVYLKVHPRPPSRLRNLALTDGARKVTLLVEGEDLDACRFLFEKVLQRLRDLVREKGGRLRMEESD